MSLLWQLLCLGAVALISGALSQKDETFRLYYPPHYQVLRDADSPVLLATYDANSFLGVRYYIAPGYKGIPQPRKKLQPNINLNEDIARTIQMMGYSRFKYTYISSGSKGTITFYEDGSYQLEHGHAFPLSSDELARHYLSALKNQNSKRDIVPDTVYPEILVIVHNDIFRSLNGNVDETVKYVTEFWAKVDMRLRGLQNPKVRLNIAGIVIAQSADATPYIHTSDLAAVNANWNMELNKVALYINKQPDLKDFYDVVALMVKLPASYSREYAVTGVATERGRCAPTLSQYGLLHSALMIINDDGRYGGVHVGAHEMGHVLGAPHDWDEECREYPNVAYIMSYVYKHDRILEKFSFCTANKIREHLNSGKLSCLYNKPNIRKSPPQTLHKFFVREICESELGKGAYTKAFGDKICSELIECEKTEIINGKTLSRNLPVLAKDGTICGNGKICLVNQCVPESVIYW